MKYAPCEPDGPGSPSSNRRAFKASREVLWVCERRQGRRHGCLEGRWLLGLELGRLWRRGSRYRRHGNFVVFSREMLPAEGFVPVDVLVHAGLEESTEREHLDALQSRWLRDAILDGYKLVHRPLPGGYNRPRCPPPPQSDPPLEKESAD